jgi:hypothetical protein
MSKLEDFEIVEKYYSKLDPLKEDELLLVSTAMDRLTRSRIVYKEELSREDFDRMLRYMTYPRAVQIYDYIRNGKKIS